MDDRFPELDNRRHILRNIHQRLEQAYEANDTTLVLEAPDIEALGSELGFNRAKTYGKLNDLIQGGYLRASFSTLGFGEWRTVHSFITVEALTDRGLTEIGVMPDPDQRLISAFQSLAQRVEQDPTIPERQKRSVVEWLNQGVTLVRAVEGIADLLAKHI